MMTSHTHKQPTDTSELSEDGDSFEIIELEDSPKGQPITTPKVVKQESPESDTRDTTHTNSNLNEFLAPHLATLIHAIVKARHHNLNFKNNPFRKNPKSFTDLQELPQQNSNNENQVLTFN